MCAPDTGGCVYPPVICPDGQACNPDAEPTCQPIVQCPCFDAPDLSTLIVECRAGGTQLVCDDGRGVYMGCNSRTCSVCDIPSYEAWALDSFQGRKFCSIHDSRDGDPLVDRGNLNKNEVQACLQLLRDKQAETGVCDVGP
jgi:hypothetical protein